MLLNSEKAKMHIAHNLRERRLALTLTQAGLAKRAGVALATLRKFEQTGQIALPTLLKLMVVVGGLHDVVEATKPESVPYQSIDDVLADAPKNKRQRGRVN